VTEFDVKIDCFGKVSSLFTHLLAKKMVDSFGKVHRHLRGKARGAPKIEGLKTS